MEEWDKWSSIIRSCVLTSKTPLTPHEINRDINMLEGTNIPYQQFNHRSLEEMLRKVSGLKVFTVQGKTVIQAIPSAETAHISKMVKLQKSKKKPRTLISAFDTRFSSYNFANANKNLPYIKYNLKNKHNSQNTHNVQNNRINSADFQKKLQTNFTHQGPTNLPMKTEQTKKKASQLASKKTSFDSNSFSLCSSQSFRSLSHRDRLQPRHHSPQPQCHSPQPQRHNPQPLLPSPPTLIQKSNTHFVPLPVHTSLLGPEPGTLKNSGSSSIAQRLNVLPGPTSQNLHTLSSMQSDPRLRLNSYAEAKNLPLPTYKDLPTKNNFIYSSVTVNSKKYSSYPKAGKTKDEAEKLAAQVALDELLDKDTKPQMITIDEDLIKTRVLKIVNNYPNGLFESSIVEYYKEKYKEGLPENWLKLVKQLITLDIGANNLTILSPLNNINSEPEVLRLNSMEEFWLHIYVVYNITDIWGVIIDENHSDKIDELAKNMKTHYDAHRTEIVQALPGKYYAVFDSEWHRVRCIKVDATNQATTVFFIDRGDEDTFLSSRLHTLDQKFCKLPAQAVRVSMAGLESFRDYDEMQTMLDEFFVDKDVYVKSMKYDPNYPNKVSAQLYLEREERDNSEVNANELLKTEIRKKILDPAIYMQSDKIAQDVYISYVSEKSIFVQLKTKGLLHLKMLMNNLAKDYLNNAHYKPKPVSKFDITKLYVTKNIEDNNWYRVKITKIENENHAQVYCIDEGNILTVNKCNLILLEELSKLLVVYPNQALQIHLHKISPIMFDKKMAKHLRDLAPKTEIFYMKIVNKIENIPVVEFYKRTEDNFLASLNDTLVLEPEITSKDDNNNAKPRVRNDRSWFDSRSEFPLKTPSIPSVNSFFDVYVVMAAHPSNFTVQPLNSIHKLEKLMIDLFKVCESYTGPSITPDSIKVGRMYAAKYDDDGRWYRAYVSKIMSKNIYAIYFCDYGDYRTVSLEQLQPLPNQFYDLPYQAIKAKLHGITPKLRGDWTVKDSLRFYDLVVSNSFVSIIKSYETDNIGSTETILGLELVDTSTTKDIYISNILIDEKRADKVEELKV